jgi:leukotriene-A4 hydrolase
MRSPLVISLLMGAVLSQRTFKPGHIMPSSMDPASYANVDVIQTRHLHLDVYVNLDQQLLFGNVTLTMQAVQDASEVILDYQGLDISNIWYSAGPNLVPAAYDTLHDVKLGSAVRIYLTDKIESGGTLKVIVEYTTNDQSTAINWLTPAQTASQTLAYMFTECQDSHCRSVAPMQDTPAIKMTYTANVSVPNTGYVVRMSANSTGSMVIGNKKLFTFNMSVPIPSYLIAFSIGSLAEKFLGTRTSVITEGVNLEKDANELSQLGDLLNDVEAYLNPPNPYEWGNYSVIVQPPSFPIGGMENPLLTFASPTIIVGDKSQVYVVTHEIGHSWTGNQVTCKDWSNFWLNEGFTVFLERKISGQRNGLEFSLVEAQLGNSSLWSDMLAYGLTNSFSSLYPQLNDGTNPDDSSSEVPYEKGYQFLYYLEN